MMVDVIKACEEHIHHYDPNCVDCQQEMKEGCTEPAPQKKPWICAVCGSEDVQHAMWVNVNTKEVFEDFGTWCSGDNNWCEQCEEHTEIVEKKT